MVPQPAEYNENRPSHYCLYRQLFISVDSISAPYLRTFSRIHRLKILSLTTTSGETHLISAFERRRTHANQGDAPCRSRDRRTSSSLTLKAMCSSFWPRGSKSSDTASHTCGTWLLRKKSWATSRST